MYTRRMAQGTRPAARPPAREPSAQDFPPAAPDGTLVLRTVQARVATVFANPAGRPDGTVQAINADPQGRGRPGASMRVPFLDETFGVAVPRQGERGNLWTYSDRVAVYVPDLDALGHRYRLEPQRVHDWAAPRSSGRNVVPLARQWVSGARDELRWPSANPPGNLPPEGAIGRSRHSARVEAVDAEDRSVRITVGRHQLDVPYLNGLTFREPRPGEYGALWLFSDHVAVYVPPIGRDGDRITVDSGQVHRLALEHFPGMFALEK